MVYEHISYEVLGTSLNLISQWFCAYGHMKNGLKGAPVTETRSIIKWKPVEREIRIRRS
jgi:hypothetical protein